MEERINGFLGLLKGLKVWQIGLLVIVLLGSAGTTYVVYANTSNANREALGQNQQLIPTRYGNLVNQVSTNGSLTFPERDALTFDSAGTVAEVMVKAGQRVIQGQALATLDAATVVSLNESVADARVALRDAQSALSSSALEYSVQLASAEESVASAEKALEDANTALEDAQEPYTAQQIKAQEQAVAAARLSVKNSQEALIDLEPDFSLQLAEAVKSDSAAKKTFEDARKALAKFDSDHALELASATQTRAADEIVLKDAKTALTNYENSQGATLSNVRTSKASAEAEMAQTQARIDLLTAAQQTTYGDLSTRINSLRGILEIQQDYESGLQARIAQAEQLEANVEVAELNLKAIKEDLAELKAGPDSLQRQDLNAAVEVAQADAKVTGKTLANLLSGLDPLEVKLKQSDLALAEAALAQAGEDLADMQAGADAVDVALREKQVALAQANLNKAKADLAARQSTPDPLDQAQLQAKVNSAQRSLDDATRRLDNSNLRSPIDGLVSALSVQQGDTVQASTIIAEVVDTNVVEIDGIVDEIDVLSIKEGDSVQVSLDALPGQRLDGTISEIAPAASNQQGVVTYPVSIQVVVPAGLQLREGLTAVASIVLSEEQSVLMVPEQAIYGTFAQPVVQVMTPTGIEQRRVTLGNSDGFWVVVSSGLQQGDQVVMESAAVSTTGSGFGQIRSITGGGNRGFSNRSGGR